MAVIMLSGFYMGWKSLDHGPRKLQGLGQAFYSVDGGSTWFRAAATSIPPFDHGGKPAYEAEVFECRHSSAFVATLQCYSPDVKTRLEKAIADKRPTAEILDMEARNPPMVKKPGSPDWIKLTPQTGPQYMQAVAPICPDGSADGLTRVNPND